MNERLENLLVCSSLNRTQTSFQPTDCNQKMSHAIAHLEPSMQNGQAIVNSQ
ncbi:hypothetical protein [Coleofasciculus sp. B1-GNL1-01]|uniref:hypothetical protein n=1 Tax=Coleofasciculus sp. B1-GNL1-01 TaxID=3068484 RepID=UPI0040640F5D